VRDDVREAPVVELHAGGAERPTRARLLDLGVDLDAVGLGAASHARGVGVLGRPVRLGLVAEQHAVLAPEELTALELDRA
jgi:hypothetical protein